MTHAILAACRGFLIAVLWMDLMFDVQVLRRREAVLPEPVLDSIAAYYLRVTTEASPMGRLVAVVMAVAVATVLVQLGLGPARLARAICRDHLFCLAAMLLFTGLQLASVP